MKKQTSTSGLLFFLLMFCLAFLGRTSAQSNIFSVTTTADEDDGTCSIAHCSLREAIFAANADTSETVSVIVPAGVYTRSIDETLTISRSMTIQGDTAATTIIDGNNMHRVFTLIGSGDVMIKHITITNGDGGVYVMDDFHFTLEDSIVTNNTAITVLNLTGGGGVNVRDSSINIVRSKITNNTSVPGYNGGGLSFDPNVEFAGDRTVTIIDSEFHGNHTANLGGGMNLQYYTGDTNNIYVIIRRSLFTDNTAHKGGAAFISEHFEGIIENSTFSHNRAIENGGALYFGAYLFTIENVTFTENMADSDADGSGEGNAVFHMWEGIPPLQLRYANTILYGNSNGHGSTSQCYDGSVSGVIIETSGYNLFGDMSDCTITEANTGDSVNDITGQNPQLAPLADNGGFTQTHALLANSPAQDAVPAGECTLATDQRGISRPQFTRCDIGAFESTTPLDLLAPTLTSAGVTAETVELSWNDPNVVEENYIIERSPADAGTWSVVGSVAADVTTFMDDSVICETSYDYRVRAYDVDVPQYSDYSNIVTVTTDTCVHIGEVLYFPAGTHTLVEPIYISQSTTIIGDGIGQTIIDGQNLTHLVEFVMGGEAQLDFLIEGVTLTNGQDAGRSGVFQDFNGDLGNVTLRNVEVTNNIGENSSLVSLEGDNQILTVADSFFTNNTIIGFDGVISYTSQSETNGLIIRRSVFSGNDSNSPNAVVGIAVSGNNADVYIEDSAFINNGTTLSGTVFDISSATMRRFEWNNVTISGNGDGTTELFEINTSSGADPIPIVMRYMTVFNNNATWRASGNITWEMHGSVFDLEGICNVPAPSSGGYNILRSTFNCYQSQPTDLVDVDPQLQALTQVNNTWVHRPLADSLAVDAIPAVACTLPADQRGMGRPQFTGCDIGAYEYEFGLAPPQNLRITEASETYIRLEWDDIGDETAYHIEFSEDEINWSELFTVGADVTLYDHSDFACDTTYYYRVWASNGSLISQYSNVVSQYISWCNAPTAPVLTVDNVGVGSVSLVWTDPNFNEDTVYVERSIANANSWIVIETLGANATATTDNTALCGMSYDYRVRAYWSGSDTYSPYSNVESDVTPLCALVAPTDELLTSLSSAGAGFSWTDTNDTETGYEIERSVDNMTWFALETVAADSTNYLDDTVECFQNYYYRIRAVRSSDGAVSPYSGTIVVDPVPCVTTPTNLTATWLTDNDVELNWTDAQNETDYYIERSLSGNNTWSVVAQVTQDVTTYTDTDATLNCDATYDYRLRAYSSNDSTYSAYSSVATVYLPICELVIPENLTSDSVTETSVTMSWDDNNILETAYSIERSDDGVNWAEIATVAANVTTYVDTALMCETSYDYRVRAYSSDEVAYSDYSNIISPTTSLCTVAPPPFNLTAAAINPRSIDLEWEQNGYSVTDYIIQLSRDGGATWQSYPVISSAATSFTAYSLMCDTSYQFRIRGFRDSDNQYTTYTNIITEQTSFCDPLPTPLAPSSATTNVTSATLSLTSDASGEVDIWYIEQSVDGGATWLQVASVPAASGQYTVSNLVCGSSYSYRVSGYRIEDNSLSAPSSEININTLPCPPVVQHSVALYQAGFWRFADADDPASPPLQFRFGPSDAGWKALIGDWDGDGVDGIGLYKNGIFVLRNVASAGIHNLQFEFGPRESGWQPIVGDWDGDGGDTVGVYKDGVFILAQSNAAAATVIRFRLVNDTRNQWTALTGDWDGNGADSIGLYREGYFHLTNRLDGTGLQRAFNFGPVQSGWQPLGGDWNGDGVDTIGVFTRSIWRLRNSNNSGNADIGFNFGAQSDGWQALVTYLGDEEEAPPGSDTDADGLPDSWESTYFGNLAQDGTNDDDADSCDNQCEFLQGTDPTNPDTDSDSLLDGEELPNSSPTIFDTDNDGLSDGEEIGYGTDPRNTDTDSDSYTDAEEIQAGSDPLDSGSTP